MPPAASTAAIAAFEAPATSIVSCGFQLALGQQADAVAGCRRKTPAATSDPPSIVPRRVELAGVERLLQPAEVDHLVVLLEDLLLKPRFGRRRCSGRLAALEAVDRDAGARGLALAAAAGGLALARADAAPDALYGLAAPGLSLISLSFMASCTRPRRRLLSRFGFLDHAHQVLDLA